jgi:hypothetical protein
MNTSHNHLSTIHHCEDLFKEWLSLKLSDLGIQTNSQTELSDILDKYAGKMKKNQQHLKPLARWDQRKKECYKLFNEPLASNGSEYIENRLIESTAFEGQILWLTIKNDWNN